MLRKTLPGNWRIEETLLSGGKRSKTTKVGRIYVTQHDQEYRTVNLLRDQVRRLQERLEFIEDSRIFQDPDSPSSSGSAHVPHQAHISSSSRLVKSLAANRECSEIHERIWVLQETFLIVNQLDEILDRNYTEDTFKEFGNIIGVSENREGIEKSGSEEPLLSILLPSFQERARKKV